MTAYQERFLNTFIQAQVFGQSAAEDYGQTIAFARWNTERKPDIFQSEQIQLPQNVEFKLLYDSIRIITLRMCT